MVKLDRIPFEELRPGRFIQLGRELYKVSTPYPTRVTAQLLFPKTSRTTVRTILKEEYDKKGSAPTKAMLHRYEEAWGFAEGDAK